MNKIIRNIVLTLMLILPLLVLLHALAGNIDAEDKFAYGENVGWINFDPSQGEGVTVTNSAVTGKAWGENVGWINFNPTGGGVKIDPTTGVFSGLAWGENIGWINFAPNGVPVKTSWRGETSPPTGNIKINNDATCRG